VTDLTQVVAEAQRLYALAEQAVDQQLSGQQPVATPAAQAASTAPPARPVPPTPRQPTQASQPYRGGSQRRGPAPVTDSQLRFLQKLITDTRSSLPAILEHHQVGGLDQLSCRAAAQLIDELKAQGARA
jgi:hypothetical protein